MTELKIEVGKIVGVNGRKVMPLGLGDKNSFGEQLYKCYDYENDCICNCNFHPGNFREWQDEPKVGWVYETEHKEALELPIHYKKIKIIYQLYGPMFLGVPVPQKDTSFHILSNGDIQLSSIKLKLETGRPADED